MLTYNGVSLLMFKQDDLLNIRMTTLYSWLTGGDFTIDLQSVLNVEAGNVNFLFIHKRTNLSVGCRKM